MRAPVGPTQALVDALDHLVGERVAELVGVHVRLGRGVAHEVGEEALDDAMLADDSAGRARLPSGVRIASFCSPRSTRPSASSRFSISPADARETPSISATREAIAVEPGRGPVLADREGEEVDRLEVLVDGVALRARHVQPPGWTAPGHYSAAPLA